MTGSDLYSATRDGQTATVRTLLCTPGAQSFINWQHPAERWTAIHIAAAGGQAPVAELLIAARCDVDFQGLNEETPLYRAACGGHADVVKQLIAARCDVDLATRYGQTAVNIASQGGHTDVAALLIAARCNVHLAENDGNTPLHRAADRGQVNVVELLIAARCNVDLATRGGCTALHAAAWEGHTEVVRLLIAARCNVHVAARDGNSALKRAERRGHASICELIRNSCNVRELLPGTVRGPMEMEKQELEKPEGQGRPHVTQEDEAAGAWISLPYLPSSLSCLPLPAAVALGEQRLGPCVLRPQIHSATRDYEISATCGFVTFGTREVDDSTVAAAPMAAPASPALL